MTNLQVEYNKLLENVRNNKAQLAESNRHNSATEGITSWRNQQDIAVAQGNLAVNQAKSNIEATKAAEIIRHNKESEGLSAWSNAMQETHYQNQDSIGYYNAQVNAAKVSSDITTNAAKVGQGWTSLSNDMFKITGDLANKAATLAEAKRHNTTAEKEQTRSNQANEYETQRNNISRSHTETLKQSPFILKSVGAIVEHGNWGKMLTDMYTTPKTISQKAKRESNLKTTLRKGNGAGRRK